ncbi:MAG: hypothetical protein JKY56_06680 [Kofleriaceae bacterium]|nr:hypothetical protein [Kofleriaceae bacterium]
MRPPRVGFFPTKGVGLGKGVLVKGRHALVAAASGGQDMVVNVPQI